MAVRLSDLPYLRDTLVNTLIYHQRNNRTTGCMCGWGERPEHLGHSWAEHVAEIYEEAVRERLDR